MTENTQETTNRKTVEQLVIKISTTGRKVKSSDAQSEGTYPVIDQGEELISGYVNDASKLLGVHGQTIVFGDHSRRIKLVNHDFVPGADGIVVLQPIEEISAELLVYLMEYQLLTMRDNGYARHWQHLKKAVVQFPKCKSRQAQIASLISEASSQIDHGLSSLEKAEKQLELYRQSVLKDAFEGKLTADWRSANRDLVELPDMLLARIEVERKAAYQAELDAWAENVNQWEASGKDGKKPSKPKKPELTPVIFEAGNSAIMTENWVNVQISSVLGPQNGSTPKGISNVANGTVNYIKVDDMNTAGNEIKIQKSKMMLNAKSITDFSMNLMPEGTVIFPKRGGAIKTDKKRALSKPSCVDTNIMGLVNSSQSILNDYIYFFMKSFTLFQISDGSNIPQINNGSLKAVAFSNLFSRRTARGLQNNW